MSSGLYSNRQLTSVGAIELDHPRSDANSPNWYVNESAELRQAHTAFAAVVLRHAGFSGPMPLATAARYLPMPIASNVRPLSQRPAVAAFQRGFRNGHAKQGDS